MYGDPPSIGPPAGGVSGPPWLRSCEAAEWAWADGRTPAAGEPLSAAIAAAATAVPAAPLRILRAYRRVAIADPSHVRDVRRPAPQLDRPYGNLGPLTTARMPPK